MAHRVMIATPLVKHQPHWTTTWAMKTTVISMAINVSRCQMANATIEAAKARQRCFLKKKIYIYIYIYKNISAKRIQKSSLDRSRIFWKVHIGTMNSETLRFWSQPSWHRWCSFAAARGTLRVDKITQKPLRKVLRSCELLENFPFKQWFSYFLDCWVPEKSLQILISGIFVAKNEGNVHLDGSWINILIMLCDLGKKHSRLPSLKLQVYPLKLMVGFNEISFGLFSGAKMLVSGRVCVSTSVIFDELNVSEGSKHVDPWQVLPSHRSLGTSLNQPLKRSLIQMFRVYLFKSTISTTFI